MTTALRPYVPDVAAEWLVGDPDQRHRSVEGTLAPLLDDVVDPLHEALTGREAPLVT